MADTAVPCSDSVARFYYNVFTRLVSVMSVLCNGFVLRICISQRQTLKVYGRILALTAGFNVFYSAFGAVVGMKELPYDVYFYYFTDSPFLCYAPEMVQHFALTTTFATIFIQAALPSVQFYIRYRVLKDNRPEPAKLYYAFVILVVCFLAYTSLAHLQFEKTTDLHKRRIFEGIRGCNINDRLLPTYSVFDKSSASSQFDDKCAVAIFIACSLVVIYYGALTWLRCKEHLEKTTVMTRKLNRDINLALALQAVLPFTFVTCPTSFSLAGLVPHSIGSYISLAAMIGTALSPLLDALITLFVVPAFRKRIFQCIINFRGTQVESGPISSVKFILPNG